MIIKTYSIVVMMMKIQRAKMRVILSLMMMMRIVNSERKKIKTMKTKKLMI